jgi:hypothetical protein
MSNLDFGALLGAGGAPPDAGPPVAPGMGDAGPAPEPPPVDGHEDRMANIQAFLNDLQGMLQETQDPEEQAAISKAESALSALIASLSKQKDAAMGTTPAHKYVARANGA